MCLFLIKEDILMNVRQLIIAVEFHSWKKYYGCQGVDKIFGYNIFFSFGGKKLRLGTTSMWVNGKHFGINCHYNCAPVYDYVLWFIVYVWKILDNVNCIYLFVRKCV